jgi:formylmethanofuran dehydrogenase subunit E
MEEALARVLEEFDAEEGDGGRLVKEVVPFSAEWRPGDKTEAGECEEKPSQGPEPFDEEYVYCEACGIKVHADDARFTDMGVAYCAECYYEAYTSGEGCGEEVAWEEAKLHNDLPYCPSCYASLFVSCERCGAEVLQEEAFNLEHDLCSNCGEVVLKERAPRTEGAFYCEECYPGGR